MWIVIACNLTSQQPSVNEPASQKYSENSREPVTELIYSSLPWFSYKQIQCFLCDHLGLGCYCGEYSTSLTLTPLLKSYHVGVLDKLRQQVLAWEVCDMSTANMWNHAGQPRSLFQSIPPVFWGHAGFWSQVFQNPYDPSVPPVPPKTL